MMIHVIRTRTKIDVSNMHTILNLRACMLFNILILPIHTFELNIIWFQKFEFKVEHNLVSKISIQPYVFEIMAFVNYLYI